jgi:predicted metal-binding membrane protein
MVTVDPHTDGCGANRERGNGMLSVPDVGRRTYLALLGALALAGVCAWAVMLLMGGQPVELWMVWLLITLAVLLPSAAPMVATFGALRQEVTGRLGAAAGTVAFVTGYLGAWTAVTSVTYVLALAADSVSWDQYADAGLLALAAAYQLTPLKDRCLAHCRVPLSFLMTSWRDGVGGAFDMGAAYGARCIGAGVLLVGWLVAYGSADLVAMALVAALIAVETLSPSRFFARLGVAAALLVLAGLSAFAPGAVAWL